MATIGIRFTIIGGNLAVNTQAYERLMREALEEEAEKINSVLKEPTANFKKTKVVFAKSKIKRFGLDWEIHAGALRASKGNKIFSWINYGTPPRGWQSARPMVFPAQYKPSTRPGSLRSMGAREKFGRKIVTLRVGTSPGGHSIEARRFDQAVVRRRQRHFKRRVQSNMKKAARVHWLNGSK